MKRALEGLPCSSCGSNDYPVDSCSGPCEGVYCDKCMRVTTPIYSFCDEDSHLACCKKGTKIESTCKYCRRQVCTANPLTCHSHESTCASCFQRYPEVTRRYIQWRDHVATVQNLCTGCWEHLKYSLALLQQKGIPKDVIEKILEKISGVNSYAQQAGGQYRHLGDRL